MLKGLQEWKEAPVDCMALSFHYIQCFYIVEIGRGKQNLGNYHLHPSFSNLADAQPPLIIELDACLPEDIVNRIKGNLADIQEKASIEEKRELDDIGVNQLSQMDRARRLIEGGKLASILSYTHLQ